MFITQGFCKKINDTPSDIDKYFSMMIRTNKLKAMFFTVSDVTSSHIAFNYVWDPTLIVTVKLFNLTVLLQKNTENSFLLCWLTSFHSQLSSAPCSIYYLSYSGSWVIWTIINRLQFFFNNSLTVADSLSVFEFILLELSADKLWLINVFKHKNSNYSYQFCHSGKKTARVVTNELACTTIRHF